MFKLIICVNLLFFSPKNEVISLISNSNIRYKSVATSQALLESNRFRSRLSRRYNNHFGFKNRYGRYKKYTSNECCVLDYERWSNAFIRKHHVRSKTDFINKLHKRYASDPKYVQKIKRIERQYGKERV